MTCHVTYQNICSIACKLTDTCVLKYCVHLGENTYTEQPSITGRHEKGANAAYAIHLRHGLSWGCVCTLTVNPGFGTTCQEDPCALSQPGIRMTEENTWRELPPRFEIPRLIEPGIVDSRTPGLNSPQVFDS